MSTKDALLYAGQALGVIDDTNSPSADFFAHPLATVEGMLRSKFRRERLVSAVDALLQAETPESGAEASSRYYQLLPDDLKGQLYLVAQLNPDVDVTFSVQGRFAISDDPDLTARLDLPLVRAKGEDADPVVIAGSPTGRVRVGLAQVVDGATIQLQAAAWVDSGTPNGSFGVRMEGLVVDGTTLPELEFSTDELAGGAVDAIVHILRFVLDATGATGTPVVRTLANHLPGFFGLTSDVNLPFPFAELVNDPSTVRAWLRQLAGGDITRLREWFRHLAGLLDDTAPITSGAPSAASPWRVELTSAGATPSISVEVWLEPGPDGFQRLVMALLIHFAEQVPGRVAIDARVELMRLPLDGAAKTEMMPSGSVLVTAPPEGSMLVDTADAKVGSLRGGIRWDGAGLRPVLEVLQIQLPGTDKLLPRLDLTDYNVLSDTVHQAATDFIKDKLGAPGNIGAALLTLVGLDGGGPGVDLTLLTVSPTRAIADLHRRALLDGTWDDRYLRVLGTLVGVDAAERIRGTGDPATPWRLTIAHANDVLVELTAVAQSDGDRVFLAVGLAFSATTALPGQASVTQALSMDITIATFEFASDAVTTTLLPWLQGSLSIAGIDTILPEEAPLRCESWSAVIAWPRGGSMHLSSRLAGLSLVLPDLDEQPVSLGDLLLPAAIDFSQPDLGLGLDPSGLYKMLAHLVERVISAALPSDDTLSSMLSNLIAWALQYSLGDLAGILADPWPVLKMLFAQPFDPDGPLAPVAADLLGLCSRLFAGFDGYGTERDIWSRSLGAPGSRTLLTAWLSPAGPDSDPPDLEEDAPPWLAALLNPAPPPAVRALLGHREIGELEAQLERLVEYLESGDGLVVPDPEALPDVLVQAAHPDVIADPEAITAILDKLAEWQTADPATPLVVVVPALLGLAVLDPLRGALSAVGEQIIDLNRQPGGLDPLDLTRYTASPLHIVVTDDQHLEQLNPIFNNLAALHVPHKLALVGVSVAAPAVLSEAAAAPDAYAGVITVASPAGGQPFDPTDIGLIDAIRFVRGLPLGGSLYESSVGVLLRLIDGWQIDDSGERRVLTPVELLQVDPAATVAATAALSIGGMCGEGLGDMLSAALLSADTRPRPQALVLGIAAPFLSQDASTASGLEIDSTARLDLSGIGPTDLDTPVLAFQIRAARAGGWLVGPSSPDEEVQVGGFNLSAQISLLSGDASAALVLTDVVVRGVHYAEVAPADGPFAICLQKVVTELGAAAATSSSASDLLTWLADTLGLLRKPAGNSSSPVVLAEALAQFLDDPRSWLVQRAEQLFNTAWTKKTAAVFGLIADPSAPAGTRRWTWNSTDVPIRVTVADQPWTVTVESIDGPVSIFGLLGIGGRRVITVGIETSVDRDIQFGLLTLHCSADGTVTLSDPLLKQPVVLSDHGRPAPAQVFSQLAVPVGASLGAALLSALFGAEGAELSLWRPLASLLADPAATLHDSLRNAPQAIADILPVVASWLGLPVTGSTITLLPDVLTFDLSSVDGRPTLTLATPAPLQPIPEISTKLHVALGIDNDRHVHPSFGAELHLQLGGSAGAWSELGLLFGVNEQTQHVAFEIGDGAWIDLVPHFAGVGVLTGQALDRLLPRALDLIDEKTLASTIKTRVIDIARALDVYKTSFSDGNVPLGQVTATHVGNRAAALVSPVVNLLTDIVGTSLPPGTITPDGNKVKIELPSVLLGQLNLTVAFDTLAVTACLAGAQIGPVVASLSVTGAVAKPYVVGTLDVGLDLADAIGLAPEPTIEVSAGSDPKPLSFEFYPLGKGQRADVSIRFAPVPGVTLTDAGKRQLAEHLAILPGLHIVTVALGGVMDDPLWTNESTDGPSLKQLLVAAQLMDGATGRVATSLPEPLDLVAGAGSAIAAGLHVKLSDTLSLGFGDTDGLGPQIRGYLPFDLDSASIELLMSDDLKVTNGHPLAIDVLTKDSGSWKLKPRVRVNHTGLSILGPKGKDLIANDIVRFAGVGANIGFVIDVNLSNGTPVFSVGQLAAEVDLTGVSLPILSRGGGDSNPIASGMLSSSGGDSPQPQFDVSVGWANNQLYLHIEGAEPGKPVWIVIDRGFGPLYIARIGIEAGKDSFKGEQLDYIGLLVDAAISMAGLTVALKGLTVKLPPKYAIQPDHWSFDLEGLAVAYQNSSVSIAGGLMKIGTGSDTAYYGMLQVIVSGRGITALGGYGCTEKGDPSLFAFVVINTPLGGPPYLFLIGLAGGFGYNRKLLVPSNPERVPQFPLMAALSGDLAGDPGDPQGALDVLNQMAASIPPAQGMIWLAAGVKFTTFVLIETNAVLYAQFGNGFEVGLLGLMRARLPSADYSIAAIELAMLAKYSTVDNTLAIRAQLTANSWLFTKDCRLTGGFAFMVWFSKPQAVISLGGYHPDFPVPADYPDVPRIGFRWTPASGITIKGESYFAITAEAAMTGGRLEARAEVDGVGHGEFTMYLDALLWFDPPHFLFNFGLRVSGEAFGFGFGVHADIHLELPPVYVRAHIDFIWGFDIEFGHLALPDYLSFEQFTAKFLGDAASVCMLVVKSGPAAGKESQDQNTAGKTEGNPFRVLPEFEVATATKFPAVQATYPNAAVSGTGSQVGSVFLVPMGTGGRPFAPTHSVSVTGNGQPVAGSKLNPTCETTGVPSAVYWNSGKPFPDQSRMAVDYSNMPKMVSGINLRADSQVNTSPGLGPINIAGIVDKLSPIDLPLAGARLAPKARPTGRRGAAAASAPAARSTPAARRTETVRLMWERGSDSRSPSATRAAAASVRSTRRTSTHPVAGLQMWAVTGASWRVRASRKLIVRQFNAMGRLIATSTVARTATPLHALAAAVAVQPAQAGRGRATAGPLSGWQLHTRAHPITTAAFVTATSSIAFAAPIGFPNRARPARGIRMFSLVASAGTVMTDLPITTRTVVVQLDRLIAEVDAMTSAMVACEQATLQLVERIDLSAGDGRVHLVYEVTDIDPEAGHLSVTVAIRPGADGWLPWLNAGVVGGVSGAAELIARLRADPRAVLIPDDDPPDMPSTPTALTFSKAEVPHG
jgi:large repetitive protein